MIYPSHSILRATAILVIDEAILLLNAKPSCSTLTEAAGSRFVGHRLTEFLFAYRLHSHAFQKGNGFADVAGWDAMTAEQQKEVRRAKLVAIGKSREYSCTSRKAARNIALAAYQWAKRSNSKATALCFDNATHVMREA